jgi:hypothetical protein
VFRLNFRTMGRSVAERVISLRDIGLFLAIDAFGENHRVLSVDCKTLRTIRKSNYFF